MNLILKIAGFDLSAERSGKNNKSAVPVISKKGNATLRYGIYQAVFIASIKDIDFVEYYANTLRGRKRKKGIKIKIVVKLAAKDVGDCLEVDEKEARI